VTAQVRTDTVRSLRHQRRDEIRQICTSQKIGTHPTISLEGEVDGV
jgi:hypothetical protein